MEAMDQRVNPEITRLLNAKTERRQQLAALSYAEKVRIVVQLQSMAAPILRRRGKAAVVWNLENEVEG